MDIAGVRAALHAQPFTAFTIRLADGRALHVPHPDFVAVTPRRVIVGTIDDTWSVLEPLLIVSLEHAAGTQDADARDGGPGRMAG
jgi:hypothetical protein